MNGDSTGLRWAAVSLAWDAPDLTAYNPQECPSPPYAFPTQCDDPVSGAVLQYVIPGVALSAGQAGVFDAASFTLMPGFLNAPMTVGRIEFLVESTAFLETIRIEYDPLYPGVGDGLEQIHYPLAEAHIVPPGC